MPKVTQKRARGTPRGAQSERKDTTREPNGAKGEAKMSQIQHKIKIKNKVAKNINFGQIRGQFAGNNSEQLRRKIDKKRGAKIDGKK